MEEAFIIKGGKKLRGTLPVRGSKNASLKALAASLLFENNVSFSNIPRIEDIERMMELINSTGTRSKRIGQIVRVENGNNLSSVLNEEIAKRFRASIVLVSPILAKTGKAIFPHPGGCSIGKRPIDLFFEGFKAMGARINLLSRTGYILTANNLRGIDFTFRIPSVTATETLMLAAINARGTTILRNSAQEPEIVWLADFLRHGGAYIEGVGTSTIIIKGTPGRRLHAKKTHKMMPDRIETGTFAILAAATKSKIKISNCDPEHIKTVTAILRYVGCGVQEFSSSVVIQPAKKLVSADIKTGAYPNFPTDMQAPLSVLLTQAKGVGEIFETIFSDRFQYVKDLRSMEAHIDKLDRNRIAITGPTALHGRELYSPDLRAGLAYIIAALVAKGESIIHNVYQIDRGYEKIEKRLQKVGANIKRVCL